MTDPIDLDAYRPHEVSKMLCTRCGHKWTAVHPVGVTGLECPNCHEMKGYGMSGDLEREVTVQRAVINNLKGMQKHLEQCVEAERETGARILKKAEAAKTEVAKLREALEKIAEGTRDGQHCALIASVALEG